ncbi:ABC transporter ATP-binding protein [Fulvivirga sediminis]|uniref:ATP-binding cassette domain-containing protein n=1 Tax=Fulvivirga sediminis TaxID=2803949 RepID=A0A937FD59_9BACT|nr:ATP-binding cassette domain-containing protein [Fulvivirga sediminis]MBL3658363.1 ATP-binding cassette domain-containing protein [Fulvivirga sediminis]
MEEKAISVTGLKKGFDGNEILKGIDFDLEKGENLVVLGKSGVGKSVLIKCIVKLIEPDDGDIEVLGTDIRSLHKDDELNEYRRKVGFLFQGGALYDAMTVEENMRFPLERLPNKPDNDEIEKRIEEALENVGLEDTRKKMPAELSGGMNKRIALARTLILQPQIMLYDEPTTGLDPATSKEISHLILEMQDKYKMSSVIITHDMKCAEITANRMKVIKDGVFAFEGSYDDLSSKDDPWLKNFFE